MSRYYRHLIEAGLLLDIYPNAAVAYSLRKLRSGYKQSYNLWNYSEEIQQSVWTKEGTSITSDVLIAPDGSLTADVAFETSTVVMSHSFRRIRVVTTGEEYTISFWAKANGRDFINVRAATQMSTDGVTQPTSWVDLSTGTVLSNSGSFRVAPTITSVGNDWYFIQFGTIASTPGTFTNFQVLTSPDGINTNYIGDITKGVAIWGVQISLSSSVLPYEKTVVAPSNGNPIRVRRSVDNAEQDFGFDEINDTLTDFVGYNLWSYSEELQQSVWVKTRTTVTTDTVISPDGNTTGDIVFETTESGTHSISRAQAVINGEDYSVSFYIKDEGRRYFQIRSAINFSTNNITQPIAMLDLTTETVIFNNGFFRISPTITAVGSGWYKVEYGLIANSTTTSTAIVIEYSINGTQTAYIGDITKGMAIWGLQISQTSDVKPYQKTVINAGGNGFVSIWYDQSGNGRNAGQTTPSSQAQIVSNGFVIIDEATLKPTTTWTADRYTIIGGVSPITRYLSIGVLNRTANSNVIAHIGVAGTISGVNGQQTLLWQPTTGNIRSDMYSAVNHGTNTNTGSFITTSEKNASNLKTVYLNGNALATTATQAPSTTGTFMNAFGQNGNNFTTCRYQEYIYWDSEQSANRIGIETKINDYYAIY